MIVDDRVKYLIDHHSARQRSRLDTLRQAMAYISERLEPENIEAAIRPTTSSSNITSNVSYAFQ